MLWGGMWRLQENLAPKIQTKDLRAFEKLSQIWFQIFHLEGVGTQKTWAKINEVSICKFQKQLFCWGLNFVIFKVNSIKDKVLYAA